MRVRAVAFPPEHGGWGLLFEPILVGLIAAPSAGGVAIAVAALGLFLTRHPLKIVLIDRLAGRNVPRTAHAAAFAAGYLALAAAAGALALRSTGRALLVPLACAVPLALVQVVYDARNRSRALVPEMCGAAALAVSAPAIAAAGRWDTFTAMALWAVAAARTVPAMVTVRTRVMRLHGQPAPATLPLVAHVTALATVLWLQIAGRIPAEVVAILLTLAARAAITLRASAPRVRARRIGLEELVIGLLASSLLGIVARR